MNKKDKDSSYWVAVLLVGLVLGVVAGLAIAGFAYPIYQSDKWAAWVQAVGSVLALFGVYWTTQKQAEAQLKAAHEADRLRREAEKEIVASMVNLIVSTLKKESEKISKGLSHSHQSKKALIIYEWAELHWRAEPFDGMINSLSSQNIGTLAFDSDFLEFKIKLQGVLTRLKVNPKEIIEFYERGVESVDTQEKVDMKECFNNKLDLMINTLVDDINQLDLTAKSLLNGLTKGNGSAIP